jgi:hypothetical protein
VARYNTLGFMPDQIICEDYALPNATNATLTNTVELQAHGTQDLRVYICASSTTVELASAATLRFTPLFGNNPAAGGCLVRALGTIELKEGDISLNDPGAVTTKDLPDDSTWLPGALITMFTIPKELCKAYKYMKINVATSADERADSIEAYLVV